MVSEKVLDVFELRMLDVWHRGGFRLADPVGTARLLRLLLGRHGMAAATPVLVSSGIRENWNRVFAERRSEFLASWIAPHAIAPVLDVLGGDFTVLRALLRHGLDAGTVTGCERRYCYDTDWSELPFPVHDVPAEVQLPAARCATALLCTVLHHEPDVVRLLDAAAATGAQRWLVVENCLDEENDQEFHLFVDEFFNRCLNSFDVPCVPQHRTGAQWRELLGRYGTITLEEQRADVPGMPFPYTLFVVER